MIFCAGSSSRACISKGRRCSCSACSAIRAERFDERTAENVAPARASVPPAVASDEMATQSATTLTLRPARRYRSIDGAPRFPRADPRRTPGSRLCDPREQGAAQPRPGRPSAAPPRRPPDRRLQQVLSRHRADPPRRQDECVQPRPARPLRDRADHRRGLTIAMDYSLYKTINGLTGASVPDRLFTFLANEGAVILVVLVAATFLVPWPALRAERR